tara:strand:- start:849 stop:2690 length:1842 start_codon:yes stop_codon:yes gene_type:complete
MSETSSTAAASSTAPPEADTRVRVMVELRDGTTTQDFIAALSAPADAQVEDSSNDPDLPERIVTALVDRTELPGLRGLHCVAKLNVSEPAAKDDVIPDKPTLLSKLGFGVKPPAHVDPLTSKAGHKGKGAAIIIIDSGIDIFHRAFLDENGKTRIFAIYDQVGNRMGKFASSFQVEGDRSIDGLYFQDDIQKLIDEGRKDLPFQWNPNHGTMVASIAAGSGYEEGGESYPGGVAPEADIIFICSADQEYEEQKSKNLGYSLSLVMILKWLKQLAPKFGRQAMVVNLSRGDHVGGHDGSTLLESQFGVFSGDGRDSGVCVVKSAGNVGNRQGHTSTEVPFNGKKTIDFQILKDGIPPSLCVELWFESCFPMEVTAISPDKREVATLTVKPGVEPKAEGQTTAKKNQVLLTSNRYDSDNGATRVSLRIHPGEGMTGYETGTWTIRLRRLLSFNRETARVDAWLDLRDSPVLTPMRFVRSTNDMALTIPGTADHLITVGAVIRADRPKVAAPYSSQGPTRDGKPKPEICAPGSNIRGAKAHTKTGLMTVTGTSFAAPQVSGAIALLMAKKMEAGQPLPNATQIRHALIHSSSGYDGSHDPCCGFGTLNVDKFLEEL